jgi:hypothetical protein
LLSITVIEMFVPLDENACQAACISPPVNVIVLPEGSRKAPAGAAGLGDIGTIVPAIVICIVIDTYMSTVLAFGL